MPRSLWARATISALELRQKMGKREALSATSRPLYTPAERVRRDESIWTLVQGILAPLQFLVFIVSLVLVVRYLATGEGATIATVSVIAKTMILYAIMITGSLWEKAVFGHYLFVPAFFWEDVVSMLVMALHTLYLLAVWFGWFGVTGQMYLAIAAYSAYLVNAGQFLWKFRLARMADARKSVVESNLLNGGIPS